MMQQYEKLKTLLKELFELDQPDLDFGLFNTQAKTTSWVATSSSRRVREMVE